MIKLSPREKELFDFLASHLAAHGFPPSYDEIRLRMGFGSKNSVGILVDILVIKGYVRRIPRRARGLELSETKYHHAPDCDCDACCRARYSAQLKLVQASKIDAPRALLLRPADNFRSIHRTVQHQHSAVLPNGAR